MSALPLILGWVVLASEPSASTPPAGYVPVGAPAELYDLGRLAMLRDPRLKVIGFSSRAPLGARDGRTVLAEMEGPGIVQRLWLAPVPSGGRLRVTIDRQPEPVLDVSLAAIISGAVPRFPGVIDRVAAGGFVAYAPIPFRAGCRITLEGAGGGAYEVSVVKLPSADGVRSFQAQPAPEDAHDLQLAYALWRQPEALFSNEPSYSRERLWRELSIRKQTEDAEYPVDGTERSTQLFALPAGPRTVRSFEAVIDPKTTENWRSARLRIVWDGDDSAAASVDLPLGEFFGLPAGGLTYQSLLTGENEHVWSSRLPMPYRRQAFVRIDAEGPIKGSLLVRTSRGVVPGCAYLRTASRAGTGGSFAWGPEAGRGHLVGTHITAQGQGKRADWLAKSLYLLADGQPLFPHGTPVAQAFDAAGPDANGGLELAQTFPLSGFPLFRRDGDRWNVSAYRWRLTDPIPFEHSIALKIEPDNAAGATSTEDIRATVFWYSERSGPARDVRQE